MKECSKCKQILAFEEFAKCKANRDGYQYQCRKCKKLAVEQIKLLHVDGNYSDNISNKQCSRCHNLLPKDAFTKNSCQKDGLHNECKGCMSLRAKLRYSNNKDKIKAQQANYYKNNKHVKNTYWQKRIKTDVQFKIKVGLRRRLKLALTNNYKKGMVIKNLGCSVEEFKCYFESKFQPGMTWKDFLKGKIHVDHIKPLSAFNLTDPEQIKEACHYTNLQPLWCEDNIKKGSKYINTFYEDDNLKVNIIPISVLVGMDRHHLSKEVQKTNKRLVQFFDFELVERGFQITSFVKSASGQNKNKVFARKCEIKEVSQDDAKGFLDKYHILGGSLNFRLALGLFHKDDLIALATFGAHHRNHTKNVLSRFVTKIDWNVIGGLSRLSKAAYDQLGEIYTWIDLRMSNGDNWIKAGWIFEEKLNPDYFYYNFKANKVIKKQSRQKSLVNTPDHMTEFEHAKRDGLIRIFDCGKIRLKFDPKKESK